MIDFREYDQHEHPTQSAGRSLEFTRDAALIKQIDGELDLQRAQRTRKRWDDEKARRREHAR